MQSKWSEAKEQCDTVLAASPHDVKALFRRGTAHEKLGDANSAFRDMATASKLDPKVPHGNREETRAGTWLTRRLLVLFSFSDCSKHAVAHGLPGTRSLHFTVLIFNPRPCFAVLLRCNRTRRQRRRRSGSWRQWPRALTRGTSQAAYLLMKDNDEQSAFKKTLEEINNKGPLFSFFSFSLSPLLPLISVPSLLSLSLSSLFFLSDCSCTLTLFF